jgi:hypothetical protein
MKTGMGRIGVLAGILATAAFVQGQNIPLSIENVEVEDKNGPRTPVYDVKVGGMSPRGNARQSWFRMAVLYETDVEYLDALTVDFYVATKPRELDMQLPPDYYKTRLFTLTNEYIDIAEGKHLCEAYIHPRIYNRYSNGKDIVWAVVFSLQDQPVAFRSSLGEQAGQWWEKIDAVPMDDLLLSRDQTPFALVDYEDFEVMKPQGNR